ncbi:MAG: DUF2062 domain-containing protein [Desulfobacteraceae bacterium]|jgi:hypothetical protein
MIASLLENKIIRPIIALLKQGITPEKIALSLALGIVLGIFPVLGSTTLLCTLAALLFRLNLPAIQIVNVVIYPLQLAFLLPFYRAGEWLFNAQHLPISVQEIIAMIDKDVWGAILFLWDTTVHAIGAWFLVGSAMTLILYTLLKPGISRLSFKSSGVQYSGHVPPLRECTKTVNSYQRPRSHDCVAHG